MKHFIRRDRSLLRFKRVHEFLLQRTSIKLKLEVPVDPLQYQPSGLGQRVGIRLPLVQPVEPLDARDCGVGHAPYCLEGFRVLERRLEERDKGRYAGENNKVR